MNQTTRTPWGSRLRALALALALALLPLLGLAPAAVVQAASGDCTTSGDQVTCTFSYTGAEQTWQVPPGVSSVQVTAVGGPGSSNVAADGTTVAGGKGANVTATVPLPAGTTTLYVEVGASSVSGCCGFNGGGGVAGHEGGDASDVRTWSMAGRPFFKPAIPAGMGCGSPWCPDPRLVVAGGGGGAGGCGAGGQAGDPSATGAGASGIGCAPGGNAGFGGTGGGAGYAFGAPGPDFNGLGGGNGGNPCVMPFVATRSDGTNYIDVNPYIINPIACIRDKAGGPGGGAGGYYGGANGGITIDSTAAGGGGAGSSFWVSGATNTSMATDTTGTPSVTITYTPDTTPPSAKPSQSPAANAAGWNTSDVTVTWNWTDNAAGVDAANCTTSSASSGEGALTLTATCKDLAGNQGSASYAVKVDKTAPTVSAAAASQPNPSGWYTAPVSVQFTCADALSGIPAGACPADQLLSADGTAASSTAQTVADAAGNPSDASNVVSVKLDQTAPAVTCAAPDGAWHPADVSLACTAGDATSGLANAADATFQLSTSVPGGTETANAATAGRSVADVAGNAASAGPIGGNMVDKKAPSITLSQPAAATYRLNQAVAASYSCSDGGSGVASCAGPVASGANIDTSTAGTRTFTVTATDNVGNASSQSVTYTVVAYQFSGFLAPVNGPPTVNTGKAGKVYAVKFQLTDASGAFVSSLGAVKSITYQSTSCNAFSADPTDPLETSTTGNSGLRYDSTANQYVYTWATPSAAGCYTLFVTLDSGQVFPAYFNLAR